MLSETSLKEILKQTWSHGNVRKNYTFVMKRPRILYRHSYQNTGIRGCESGEANVFSCKEILP